MQVGCGVIIHARGDGRLHYGEPAHLLLFWRAAGVRRSQTDARWLPGTQRHQWVAGTPAPRLVAPRWPPRRRRGSRGER